MVVLFSISKKIVLGILFLFNDFSTNWLWSFLNESMVVNEDFSVFLLCLHKIFMFSALFLFSFCKEAKASNLCRVWW